jgi:hypothetical protein
MEQNNSEEYTRRGQHSKYKKPIKVKILAVVGVVIIISAVSFYGGTVFQKNHQTTSSGTTGSLANSGAPSGGGRFSRNRVIGQVSAISSTNITVQDRRSGSTVNLAIVSTTQISSNGNAATSSDIQVGDTVFVTKDSSNTSDAASIVVNPGFGGSGSPQPNTVPAPTTSTN